MTYDQYQQIYNAAKAQIEDRVNKLQPRAGNNASVNGMGISIEVDHAEEADDEETWSFALLCKIEQWSTVGKEEPDYNPNPYITEGVVAYQPRGTTLWIPVGFDPGIYLNAEVTDIPPDDTGPIKIEGFTRTCSFEFFSTSYIDFPNEITTYEPNTFKFPVKVTVEMVAVNYKDGGSVESYTVVGSYNFFVGFEGDKKFFSAPYQDKTFYFRITNIERTA